MSECMYCRQSTFAIGVDGPVCPDCWEEGYGRKPVIAGLRTPVKVMSVDDMADRIEELEAKLAKLVDAVTHQREMVCQDFGMQIKADKAVDDALAELKGEK